MIIHTFAVLPALCALAAGAASAQVTTPNADVGAIKPHIEYRSEFTGYQPYRDGAVSDWRTTNDTVGALNGHVGHVAPSAVLPDAVSGGSKSGPAESPRGPALRGQHGGRP